MALAFAAQGSSYRGMFKDGEMDDLHDETEPAPKVAGSGSSAEEQRTFNPKRLGSNPSRSTEEEMDERSQSMALP